MTKKEETKNEVSKTESSAKLEKAIIENSDGKKEEALVEVKPIDAKVEPDLKTWVLLSGTHRFRDENNNVVVVKGGVSGSDKFYHKATCNAELPVWAKDRARLLIGG